MDVRARINEIGRRVMGRDWWARVADELAAEFEPVVAERDELRAENARLRRELDAAQLRSIEARNPGIDMDEVRRLRDGAVPDA